VRRRWTTSSILIVPLSLILILVFAAHAETRSGRRSGSFDPVGTLGSTERVRVKGEEILLRDELTKALRRGDISEATYALNRALSIFHPAQVRARFGHVAEPGPRDGTPILRDLVARYTELSPAQRMVAQSILARPTDGGGDPERDGYTVPEEAPVCNANGCIHYVSSTSDAPPAGWVDSTTTAFETVWAKEIIQYGYRPPKSDITSTNHGPDGKIDIYLADVGANGLFGYCATDDPNAFNSDIFDVSVFCVIDNDMSPVQFQGASGVPALQVTLAHEFFHAVQCAYDCFEDRWFSEGTATWMEDEVFDAVNDNRQYLPRSQLSRPRVPLDFSDLRYSYVYGAWIWFRFMSEYLGKDASDNPSIIRRSWEYADASAGGPDQYSLKAIASAINEHDSRFRFAYADFGVWNDVPGLAYSEGNSYPVPPYANKHKITAGRRVQRGRVVMDHLTQGYVAFMPRSGVSSTAKLRIAVDLPALAAGSEASVVMINSNGGARYKVIRLNTKGNGRVTVPFGRGRIATVDLVITNASERTRCWVDDSFTFSCAGNPKDDRLRYVYAAGLIQ
jgi:hypothetical protein